jgi:DNA-binding NarL/FixJ family response regulator
MFHYLRRHGPVDSKLSVLSEREREVLGLLAEGLTNREIAARLFISEKTVRNHVSGVLRKLDFRHRTEAALFAAPLRDELRPPP